MNIDKKNDSIFFSDLEIWIPALSESVVMRSDEKKNLHIVDLNNIDHVYMIKGLAAQVVNLIDSKKSWGQIANILISDFKGTPKTLEKDLLDFSNWLLDSDLIDHADILKTSLNIVKTKNNKQLEIRFYKFGSYEKLDFEAILQEMPITAMASSRSGL